MADEKTPDFVISGAADLSDTEEAEQPTVLNLAALAEAAEAADDNTVYALDKNLNARPTMTTEQILAAIQKAVTTGVVTDEFTAFIEMIREQNKGIGLKFWLGTTAQFTALEKTDADTVYFLTDSTSLASLDAAFVELKTQLGDGSFEVKKATEADNVKSKINDKNISEIFENDGLTVKNATAAGNAKKVNDLEIKLDSNGVLKIGDVIIPQKKLLWSGNLSAGYSGQNVTLSENINNGDTLEFHYEVSNAKHCIKAKVYNTSGEAALDVPVMCDTTNYYYISSSQMTVKTLNKHVAYIKINATPSQTLKWCGIIKAEEGQSPNEITAAQAILTAVYKIIE